VFEIERIFPNSAVQSIAVYTGNNESLWQLSQKHIVLKVIHVAGGYHVHFHFYSSDGVFTDGLFQCFHVTHSNGGAQLYLSHIH
jgi:methionine-rich copper-binding protein CopC